MNKFAAGIGFAVAAAFASAALAETSRMTGTITALDASTRSVTLKSSHGRDVTLVAGPEVKNLAEVKLGGVVDVEYVEATLVELKGSGKPTLTRMEDKPTAKPGADARRAKIVATVVAVDPVTQVATLKSPSRTLDLKVKDPAQFKLVKVGDQVEASYTEAVAVALAPSKAPPRIAPKK